MYEMVKEDHRCVAPRERVAGPRCGPQPEQHPVSHRRGPGPLRGLGAGHGGRYPLALGILHVATP